MRAFHTCFYENRRIYFMVLLGLMAIGLIFNIIFGTQFDTQFTDGALTKYSYAGAIDQEKTWDIVQATTSKPVAVNINEGVKSADDGKSLNNVSTSFFGTGSLIVKHQQAVAAALEKGYPSIGFAVVESSPVNLVTGRGFFLKRLLSILIVTLLLIVYITFRFKKVDGASAGTMATIVLLHDVTMAHFVFITFRMSINDDSIAVVLVVLGYSPNDMIIIYDRICENCKLMDPKTDYGTSVDVNIDQTLTRPLYIASYILATVAMVYIVNMMYNPDSMQTFVLLMMVGIITDCYSSVCVAGPLYVMQQKHEQQKEQQAVASSR